MGLTAAFITCRVGAEPAVVDSWTPFSDVAEGWLLRRGWMVGDNAEGLAGLLGGVVGPALAAFAIDSDFCVAMGAVDGTVAWRWVFNEETVDDPEGPDEALAARIRAVVPRIAEWSRTAGLGPVAHEPLEELLERGYILAEEGLFALLVELGVCARQAAPVDEESFGARAVQVAPGPPAKPQLMHHGFLAAPIDHHSQGWRAFVRTYELEAWGEPPALVVEGRAIGGGPTFWDVHLASDPPVHLFGLGAVMGLDAVEPGQLHLDWDGRWVRVPDRVGRSLEDAVAWARANVGWRARRHARTASGCGASCPPGNGTAPPASSSTARTGGRASSGRVGCCCGWSWTPTRSCLNGPMRWPPGWRRPAPACWTRSPGGRTST
jgi:hypothetical protein